MIAALCIGLALFLSGCTAAKIDRHTRKSTITAEAATTQNQTKKNTLFDRSTITEQDYSLRLIPIDPSKEMGHSTNPTTGEQEYRNAIPVYERKSKQTKNDISHHTDEAKTNATTTQTEATTDETNKSKIKFSVPWYAFLILGFFGFATIIGLFFIWKLTKSISAFSGTLASFESRLKTLEQ